MRGSVFRSIGLISLLALAASPALGQEGRVQGQPLQGQITGQVRYAAGGSPAFNILVNCDSFSGGSVGQQNTDRNGTFRFSNLKPDQYVITVRVPGFIEERETVELQTTASQYLQFRLKSDGSGGGSGRASAPAAIVDANVPPAAQKEFEKGEAALAEAKKESPEQAALHYQKALVIYPRFVQAQLKLGTVYMDLQQWDKAEQALRKTIELEPKTANAFFALGQLYLHQKKFDQAEKALTDGLAIETRSAQAHLTLALVYWDRVAGVKDEKQWRPLLEKSYEQVKQALTIDANLAAAHLLKGNLLFKVQRAADAMTEYEEYLRLDPSGQFAAQTRALVEKIKKALAGQKP